MAIDVNRNRETIKKMIRSASNWQFKSTSAMFFSKNRYLAIAKSKLTFKTFWSGPFLLLGSQHSGSLQDESVINSDSYHKSSYFA